ncbi:hypothetical protein LZC95_40460 [Pendulispora brunnea]|uniref:Uncharacterized protein n=1 Tax=Pendulispora brunnea TaxID=2905690 RepID=A0ABZ2K7B6_9BACT
MEAHREMAYATCADGNAIGVNCGLITKHVGNEEFRAKFRAKYCAEPTTEEKCQLLFQRLVDAELAKRYFAADSQAVIMTCDLRPTECDDPLVYERYLLDSHNAHVREKHAKRVNAIEEEREQRQAEQTREAVEGTVAVISAAGQIAREVDYQKNGGTKCHSYPDVFSGAVTYCKSR